MNPRANSCLELSRPPARPGLNATGDPEDDEEEEEEKKKPEEDDEEEDNEGEEEEVPWQVHPKYEERTINNRGQIIICEIAKRGLTSVPLEEIPSCA